MRIFKLETIGLVSRISPVLVEGLLLFVYPMANPKFSQYNKRKRTENWYPIRRRGLDTNFRLYWRSTIITRSDGMAPGRRQTNGLLTLSILFGYWQVGAMPWICDLQDVVCDLSMPLYSGFSKDDCRFVGCSQRIIPHLGG